MVQEFSKKGQARGLADGRPPEVKQNLKLVYRVSTFCL